MAMVKTVNLSPATAAEGAAWDGAAGRPFPPPQRPRLLRGRRGAAAPKPINLPALDELFACVYNSGALR